MTLSRRDFIRTSAFATIAAPSILTSRLFAQQQTTTRFVDMRGNVGYFIGRGGTIGWLASSDGAVAVDSQFPDTAQACVYGLKDRSSKGIQFLINTHHHGDHVGGNPAFRESVGRIVQQERCAQYHKSTTAATAGQQAYADLTFGGSWSAQVGAEKVWAKYYGAGHTGGDAVVVFERANIVHMGDLMFNRMHPFIDRPNGASIRSWITVLTKVADQYKDATFIFGHAKTGLALTGPRADLLFFRDYLSAVVDLAQKGIAAGKPVEEIVTAAPIPGFDDFQTGAPTRLSLAASLGVAYAELTNAPIKT